MVYQKFSPDERLSPFVECYFVWDSEGPLAQELVVESPPSGYCSLVFNYGDAYTLQNSKYERLPVPQQFIAGQAVFSYKLFLQGAIGIAGIVLKPAALATLFRLPAYQYVEERIPLQTVFPQPLLEPFAEKLRGGTPVEKAAVLESFALRQFDIQQPEPDFIDEAAERIIQTHGLLQVGDLVKDGCMSRRTFERRFFQKVGLSPKYYARIIRMGYVFNLIAGKQAVNWKDLFYDSEFYDQAHFIKDFQEFTGRTPQQYLQSNNELVNLVKKPRQEPLRH